MPALLVGTGLLLATSSRSPLGSHVQPTSHNRLADLVTAEQHEIAADTLRQSQLQATLDRLTAQGAGNDVAVTAARDAGVALQGPVGLEPVVGPTVTVSLDDAPRGAPVAAGYPAPTPDDLVVHQQDVQAVVNALWAGGAEAMTIMGQRVIATTAVRCVGNTLLLAGQVYSPPFVVTAIGARAALISAVAAAPDVKLFEQYVQAYGLRLSMRSSGRQQLPGYDGSVELSYATPISGGSR